MADSLARLIVTLEAQTATYQKGLENANKQLEKFGRTQTQTLNTVTTGFKHFSRSVSQLLAGSGILIGFRALEQKLGSVAEKFKTTDAAAATYVKTMDRLQKSIDEGWLKLLQAIAPAFDAIGQAIDDSSSPLGRFVDLMKNLQSAWDNLPGPLKKLLTPGGGIVAGIEANQKLLEGPSKFAGGGIIDRTGGFSQFGFPAGMSRADITRGAELLATEQRAKRVSEEIDNMFAREHRASQEATKDWEDQVAAAKRLADLFADDLTRSQEEYNARLERAGETLDVIIESENHARQERQKAQEDTFKKQLEAAETFGDLFANVLIQSNRDGMKQVLSDFLKTLAIMAARAQAINLFNSAQSSGGWFGGLLTTIFGGPKAAGGPVMAGRSYWVGEQGPEMFTPQSSGNITPNGGAGAVNVYNNVTVGDVATRSQLVSGLAMIKEQTKKEVADSMFRRRMR